MAKKEQKVRFDGSPYRRQRKRAGYTQEEAADLLPFSLRSLQAYETGEAQPKYQAVCALAQVYSCKIDDFGPDGSADDPS